MLPSNKSSVCVLCITCHGVCVYRHDCIFTLPALSPHACFACLLPSPTKTSASGRTGRHKLPIPTHCPPLPTVPKHWFASFSLTSGFSQLSLSPLTSSHTLTFSSLLFLSHRGRGSGGGGTGTWNGGGQGAGTDWDLPPPHVKLGKLKGSGGWGKLPFFPFAHLS